MKKKMPSKEFTEAEILDFLNFCDSIDRSGQDGGWTFNLLVTHEPGDYDATYTPTDMRISVRGEYDLRNAVVTALKIKRGF